MRVLQGCSGGGAKEGLDVIGAIKDVSKPCICSSHASSLGSLMGLPNPIFLANLFSIIETSKL